MFLLFVSLYVWYQTLHGLCFTPIQFQALLWTDAPWIHLLLPIIHFNHKEPYTFMTFAKKLSKYDPISPLGSQNNWKHVQIMEYVY